jgi:phage head maturation protease
MVEVLKGNMRGFSVAGNAKDKEMKCEHGVCWTEVNELDIYEVTLCVSPMNQKSYITDIVQKPDPSVCPECYEGNQVTYDSKLSVQV